MNIILGGTHGLGGEIAKQLRADGEETYVLGRSYDPDLHGNGNQLDLAKPDHVSNIARHIGIITADANINFYWCAGKMYKGDFAEQVDVENIAAVNFAGPLPLVHALWRRMQRQKAVSNFVVVSSSSGVTPRTDEAVYAATKYAQVGLTRSLGLEAERLKSKVRVALILPGGMQTDFWNLIGKPDVYDEFLEPKKVARKIIDAVRAQDTPYYEEAIPRGSL